MSASPGDAAPVAGARRSIVREVLLAFAFLSRLPLPAAPATGADLGRSTAWFPLAGAAMGLVLAGGAWAASRHVPPAVAAVLATAALAWMTGGLHLDGVADVFDGLGGGRGDRERILRIMRDSRIGAHGAAALVLVLALKVAALSEVLARGELWPLVVAPVVSRFAVVPLVVLFPYAREEGLGKAFRGTAAWREIGIAACIAAACVAPSAPASLWPAVGGIAAAVAVAASVHRRVGGLTGDVYGAAIEIAEAALLAVAALR